MTKVLPITRSMFVDNCKDRNVAEKKARKILRKRYPVGELCRNVFSIHQQGYKKGRYVVWYEIDACKRS